MRTTGQRPWNWATRSSTSDVVRDGLSTLAMESSKASGASVKRDATSASLMWPSCRGRKEPGSTAPCHGSLTSIRPSGCTVMVWTPEAEPGSVRALTMGSVWSQREVSRRSPSGEQGGNLEKGLRWRRLGRGARERLLTSSSAARERRSLWRTRLHWWRRSAQPQVAMQQRWSPRLGRSVARVAVQARPKYGPIVFLAQCQGAFVGGSWPCRGRCRGIHTGRVHGLGSRSWSCGRKARGLRAGCARRRVR